MTAAPPVDAFRTEVMSVLGHAPEVIQPGRLQRFATSAQRGDTAGWCLLFDDQQGGVYGCFRRGLSQSWSADARQPMTRAQRAELARKALVAMAERDELQRQRWAENAQRIHRAWAESVPLKPGDAATLYLERRGLAGGAALPDCLRLHPAMPYWHAGNLLGNHPALVAPLQQPDGRLVALHRTYLTLDGHKAGVPVVKKLSGAAGSLAGASIPLFEPIDGVLGVAEGIETALAGWRVSGVPTVAAYCAGSLAGWRWPLRLRSMLIFADSDDAGRVAADRLRQRAQTAGLQVEVVEPTVHGTDWCDVWAQSMPAQSEGFAA